MSSKTKFVADFRVLLRRIEDRGNYYSESDVREFRRWIKDDLMSFKTVSAHEQFTGKINYEISIGNENESFLKISDFMMEWLKNECDNPLNYIWYHGTNGKKLEKIMKIGMMERSSELTFQHEGFEHDIGTISLSKGKRDARFFSAIGNPGDQIILHVDIRKLDPDKMKYRILFDNPDGEILYSGDISTDAIVEIERI